MRNSECIDFSICTIQGYLSMSVPSILFPRLMSIFKCNEKGLPFYQQTADSEYFKKLKAVGDDFLKTNKKAYKPIQFLKNIPINEIFMIVPGTLNDNSSLNIHTEINKKIHEINRVQYPITGAIIPDYYNIYYWGDKKARVGEADKKIRVCRFCGNSSTFITFKNNSHAISESLGNKLLFCNEECDSCNADFSAIENDFFNIHHLLYSLYQKKGKDGIQNFKGKSIEIDNKYNSGLISIKTDFLSTDFVGDLRLDFNEQCLKYSNQNIYRCLCKFALSLIDERYLNRLSDTILWVRNKKRIEKLPTIWKKSCEFHDQPMLALYIRKEEIDKGLPEFVLRFFVLNIEYLFVFPIVESIPIVFSESTKKELNKIFILLEYNELDLSSDERMDLQISFNFKLQEGTEIITINKSEYDILSDIERIEKFPNASGFRIIDDLKK